MSRSPDRSGEAPLALALESLTLDARARLEEDGYVIFPGLLSGALAAALARRCDELAAAETAAPQPEPGCVRVGDLIDKDDRFDVCFTHPVLLAAVAHVLRGRAFKLSALSARDPLPGGGHQGLHADWPRPVALDDAQVCNSVWMLDEFSAENGATRVVPGSHLLANRLPYQDLPDLDAPHPRETLLVGPPGTLAVFSSHLWHGGTRNRSARQRRSVFAYFVRREQPPLVDPARSLRADTVARLSPAARRLVGV